MKITKVTQDKTQTRSTIPKHYVKKLNITSEDSVAWEMKRKKLIGKLIKKEVNKEYGFN